MARYPLLRERIIKLLQAEKDPMKRHALKLKFYNILYGKNKPDGNN